MQKIIILVQKSEDNDGHRVSLLARELAWEALEELTGTAQELLKAQGICLEKEQSGCPVWKGIEAEVSISHTGPFAAAAVSFLRIGIDLEPLGREHLRVAKRMFSTKEQLWMETQRTAGVQDAFAQLWTLRESYAKWTGLGLAKMPPVEFLPSEGTVVCSDTACQAGSIRLPKWELMLSYVVDAGQKIEVQIGKIKNKKIGKKCLTKSN